MKTKIASLLMICIFFLSVSAFADGIPHELAQQMGTEYLGPPDVNNPHDIYYDEPSYWMIPDESLPDIW